MPNSTILLTPLDSNVLPEKTRITLEATVEVTLC